MTQVHWDGKADLPGQVAIVTGGGRGIGRASAQLLAGSGAAVVITARTKSEVDETAQLIKHAGGRALAFVADVTDFPASERIVAEAEQKLGPITLLVNNAAAPGPITYDWESDSDEWWQAFNINLQGPYLWTKAVLPGMMSRKGGRVVNVTSSAAFGVRGFLSAYSSSKAGLNQMTACMAAGVKQHGIAVFALSVSGNTALVKALQTAPATPDPERVRSRKHHEQYPDATEKSAHVLLFLASGKADALTGRIIGWLDSPQDLIDRTPEIVRDNLLVAHLRELPAKA